MKKIFLLFFSLSFFIINCEAHNMKNTELTVKQQKIAEISALTANGNLDKLKTVLNDSLDSGLSINEINEVLIQLYAYAGFPKSLNAINVFINVIDVRKNQGIEDQTGPQATILPSHKSKYEKGKENYAVLFGNPDTHPKARFEEFAPIIEVFLKEHLFADIFGRGILSFKDREIATVAALASMDGTTPQLKAHFIAAMNVGLSQTEAEEIIALIQKQSGPEKAQNASQVLKNILIKK